MLYLVYLYALWNFFVPIFSNELGYDCEGPYDYDSIHLQTSHHLKSKYHANILDSLNNKLREKCSEYYDFNQDLHYTSNFGYINLFDPHYYQDKIENDFVYAGDINVYEPEADVNVANFTRNTNITTDPKEDNSSTECKNYTKDEDIWKIERININTHAAKLVTKYIQYLYKDLVTFITSIQYHSINNITTQDSCMPFASEPKEFRFVLVCSDTLNCFNSKPYSRQLKFIFKDINECEESMEKFKDSMLAVIAPKPFKMSYETIVPAIFYASYTDSKHESQFPNSLNLISEEQLKLKHAFLKFIRLSGWRRVAIISDFSPNSIDFENELTELFYNEGILHKVEYGDSDKEFEKALQNLHMVDTRIVIANVNEKNALKLAAYARIYKSLVFLFRVPAVWNNPNERLISISLGVANNHPCRISGKDKSYCSGILEGLRIVATAKSNFKYETKTSKKDFYRKFKKNMKSLLRNKFEATIARSLFKPILTMSFDESGIIDTYDQKTTFDKTIQDAKRCYTKSNNFDKPCDPLPLLYIMLVIMMFAILVLILTCYFHNTSPLNSRTYEQL